MRKAPTAWENVYGEGSLVMGDTIYSRYGRILIATACPTRVTRFGKFTRGSKLRIGVIKKQDFGITYKVVKALLEIWEDEWKVLNRMSERQR